MFAIAPAGKATAASTSLSIGLTPAAAVWPICRTGTAIRGLTIPSADILTMVCPTITRAITASTSMSVLAGIGPVGITIAGTTGMVAIRITGMGRMSLLSRTRM